MFDQNAYSYLSDVRRLSALVEWVPLTIWSLLPPRWQWL